MSLYAIGDLHLSHSVEKPMDIFGGWQNYEQLLKENWENTVKEDDITVVCGDISWGMTFDDCLEDFAFIDRLPGKKYILKGNHDYWWTTKSKIDAFFQEHGFSTLNILHNNGFVYGDTGICASRGWVFDNSDEQDEKIAKREAGRLEASINFVKKEGCKELIAFLHYPPVSAQERSSYILDVLIKNNVSRCVYGHVHGKAARTAFVGQYSGIGFELVSADYLKFTPKMILA